MNDKYTKLDETLPKESEELWLEYNLKVNKILEEYISILEQDNAELKKQLEEKIKIGVADHKYASQCEDKVITMETQQKEFINWLEAKIKGYEAISDLLFNHNKELKVYKEALQKYKEIIGGKEC